MVEDLLRQDGPSRTEDAGNLRRTELFVPIEDEVEALSRKRRFDRQAPDDADAERPQARRGDWRVDLPLFCSDGPAGMVLAELAKALAATGAEVKYGIGVSNELSRSPQIVPRMPGAEWPVLDVRHPARKALRALDVGAQPLACLVEGIWGHC